jgi:hypothetical protein
MSCFRFWRIKACAGCAALMVGLMLAAAPAQADPVDAAWTGGAGTSNYSDAANWDIGVVPLNDLDTYNVSIPASASVTFNVDDPGAVTDLNLGTDSVFTVNPGHSLTVLDDAALGGLISAEGTGTTFAAMAAGAAFSGNKARLSASGGASISLAATSYSTTGWGNPTGDYLVLFVDGLGSALDLASLQSLNAGFNDGRDYQFTRQRIMATNSGLIDLSALQELIGPYQRDDRLDIIINTSGSIDLSALQSIHSAGSGNVRFDLDVPTFSLFSLDSAANVIFELFTDSVWGFPNLTSLGSATITLDPGATLNMPMLLEADGGTYTFPNVVRRASGTPTTINAESLIGIDSVNFNLDDGGVFYAPLATSFTNCSVGLTPARTLTLGTLDNIDNARIQTSAGAEFGTFYGDLAATTYSSTGLDAPTANYLLFSAGGAGTVLDLSSLQSFYAGFNDGRDYNFTLQRIEATAGGLIDLSGVQTLTGPYQRDDRLDIIINSGGSVDFSSLASITTANSGTTRFDVDELSFSLPALEAAANARFDMVAGSTLDLPALTNLTGATFNLETGCTLNVPALTTQSGGSITVPESGLVNAINLVELSGVTLNMGDGGALNTPSLTVFTSSSVTMTPDRMLTSGGLENINHSRLHARAGAAFGSAYGDVVATTYSSTGLNAPTSDYLVFSASGAGSVLDLSSLQSFDAGFNDGRDYNFTRQRIEATAGGVVDLSGVQSINGPYQRDDRLDIIVNSDGLLDLSSLMTITTALYGITRFDVDASSFTLASLESATNAQFDMVADSVLDLPSLTSLSGVTFNLETGCTLEVPALTHQNGGTITVPEAGAVNAESLVALNGVTVNIGTGGVLSAPNLTDFSGSVVSLTPDGMFSTGALETIDNARIAVSGGAEFGVFWGDVHAETYTSTALNSPTASFQVFAATGTRSVLDLSCLQSINAGFNDGRNYHVTRQRFEATAGGVVDLSGVQTMTGPYQVDDYLDINVNSSGLMDLSGLQYVTSANSGQTRFNVHSEGTLLLGDLTVTNRMSISLADAMTTLDVAGSLLLDSGSSLTAGSAAQISIAGNLSFNYTAEADLSAQAAVVHFDGSGLQYLEVAGEDVGFPLDDNALNFGLGQMIVGQNLEPTTVELLDVVDNGNRTDGDPEALYLYGLGGPDGLHILGGSTLVIHNIQVYTREHGLWIHINRLFEPGVNRIEYDEGYIAIEKLPGDLNVDGYVDLGDYSSFNLCVGGPGVTTPPEGCSAEDFRNCDLDYDGDADMTDIRTFQETFTGQ